MSRCYDIRTMADEFPDGYGTITRTQSGWYVTDVLVAGHLEQRRSDTLSGAWYALADLAERAGELECARRCTAAADIVARHEAEENN